jgi:hypothetical protein
MKAPIRFLVACPGKIVLIRLGLMNVKNGSPVGTGLLPERETRLISRQDKAHDPDCSATALAAVETMRLKSSHFEALYALKP